MALFAMGRLTGKQRCNSQLRAGPTKAHLATSPSAQILYVAVLSDVTAIQMLSNRCVSHGDSTIHAQDTVASTAKHHIKSPL